MGECAHAFVLREFDWQVELGRLEAVITQVARRRASSNAAAEIGFGDAVPAIST
jgi:hypothetical protein